ncbi:NRDE family protein [Luteibacter aegosomatissinici]|uniref:NRDE family protein n=1 Tax=Luteibacter aegosomatissinici TaxID=2911539 RepID=UPI001FFBC9E2|nr:NRDE family protein [Luteibacter aegosomatissinici]UPG94060.1 NRDE family protein [Luteibacter aegosomatissinici]
MCLIAFAWRAHPRWRLVMLGNRDEFHARPTAPLAHWDEAPQIAAGRDLEAGGTWAGVAPHGRTSIITNVRDLKADHSGLSRGLLVADYLGSNLPASAHALELIATARDYRPFNLLTFDHDSAYYLGNHPDARYERVSDGVHGLSNADFNAPWPKTRALVHRLEAWIEDGREDIPALFTMLSDQGRWPDDLLPDTGIGIERERFLSSAFIVGENYGTRASTVILVGHDDEATIIERRFGPNGVPEGETRLDLPP